MAQEPPDTMISGPRTPGAERTIRLALEYDGTDFSGWQVQPGRRTVQGVLEGALVKMLSEEAPVTGAGRTDAGVHATGQVAHFRTLRTIPVDGLFRGLNSLLPWDLRVKAVDAVPASFHARKSAVAKEYRYQMWVGENISPFLYRYCHHLRKAPDLAKMSEAARVLIGRHDFSCFRAAGSSVRDSIRTIHRVDVESSAGLIEIKVSGDGFLRHMVRNLAGSLLEVGDGTRPADWMQELLASKNRDLAGPTAPAKGLFLVRVSYPQDLRAARGDLEIEEDAWTMRAQKLRARDRDDEDDTN